MRLVDTIQKTAAQIIAVVEAQFLGEQVDGQEIGDLSHTSAARLAA